MKRAHVLVALLALIALTGSALLIAGKVGAVPSESAPACVDYDGHAVSVASAEAYWKIESQGKLLGLAGSAADAQKVRTLAKQYSRRCHIGNWADPTEREYTTTYWEPATVIPDVDFAESCTHYEGEISITKKGPYWAVSASRIVLTAHLNEEDAKSAAELARRNSALCYIGRELPRDLRARFMTHYWRR